MPAKTSISRNGRIAAIFLGVTGTLGGGYHLYNTMNPAIPAETAARTLADGLGPAAADYLAGTLDADNPHSTLRRMCSLLNDELNTPLRAAGATTSVTAAFATNALFSAFHGYHDACFINVEGTNIAYIADMDDLDSTAEINQIRQQIMKHLPESDIEKLSRLAKPAPPQP
jgi:hypothetical protein